MVIIIIIIIVVVVVVVVVVIIIIIIIIIIIKISYFSLTYKSREIGENRSWSVSGLKFMASTS